MAWTVVKEAMMTNTAQIIKRCICTQQTMTLTVDADMFCTVVKQGQGHTPLFLPRDAMAYVVVMCTSVRLPV